MAPIPPRLTKRQTQPQQGAISTADVYDELGRPLDSLLRRQKRTDRQQREDITINRQHAAQYESDKRTGTLIYRDVFPGRKYKLTLSDTTWITAGSTAAIGYTASGQFTLLMTLTEPPEDNLVEIELPGVHAIDTLEVRLSGAPGKVRGYLEDDTSSSSILDKIKDIVELITGSGGLSERMETVEQQLSSISDDITDIKSDISDLDDRVTALEGNNT